VIASRTRARTVFGAGGTTTQDGRDPTPKPDDTRLLLLAIANETRARRLIAVISNENEFLSAFGVRSLSKVHEKTPYVLLVNGVAHTVPYTPGARVQRCVSVCC
jgi:hypothetical protein